MTRFYEAVGGRDARSAVHVGPDPRDGRRRARLGRVTTFGWEADQHGPLLGLDPAMTEFEALGTDRVDGVEAHVKLFDPPEGQP